MKAQLVHTTNPSMGRLRGRTGDLYCRVGLPCVFDRVMTSMVEELRWSGQRVEIRTRNSRYVFEVREKPEAASDRPWAGA